MTLQPVKTHMLNIELVSTATRAVSGEQSGQHGESGVKGGDRVTALAGESPCPFDIYQMGYPLT